jgi:hypothetical protein
MIALFLQDSPRTTIKAQKQINNNLLEVIFIVGKANKIDSAIL